MSTTKTAANRKKVAVIGGGISGLSAAWLLGKSADVTLYEAESRLGGHADTAIVEAPHGPVAVDTGFIVYNETTYPNLTALFAHLGVATKGSDMSFAVSIDDGRLEYSGGSFSGLFVQKRNFLRPRFYAMIRDIVRFYREAPVDVSALGLESLDSYLDRHRYGRAFRDEHLYPMAAAIWSTPAGQVGRYPAASFIRFCENHGLLRIVGRPVWRTVDGGSVAYVDKLRSAMTGHVRAGSPVAQVRRLPEGVVVTTVSAVAERFDDVVLATPADTALTLLADPSAREAALLSAFRFSKNEAVLHSDPALMPQRPGAWSAWNYLARSNDPGRLAVTYWMNRLQGLDRRTPLFVTLNPLKEPRSGSIHRTRTYRHPLFDAAAIAAQKALWSLQGAGGVWFAGAWFGAGFHEDGLQSALAVAEAIGGVSRPWTVDNPNGRIPASDNDAPIMRTAAAS